MNDHEQASTPEEPTSAGNESTAPYPGAPGWGSPRSPIQPPSPPAPWGAQLNPQPARPTYEPGPAPAGPPAQGVRTGPDAPAPVGPWLDGSYGVGGGLPPYGPGGGGWHPGAGGQPWGPQPDPTRANRAARRRRATAGATAGFLLVAGAGVIIGHTTWPSSSTSRAAASAPLSSGAGSTGAGSLGNGSTGAGSLGNGSLGNGSLGNGSTGTGGSGSFGSGSTSSASTSSIAAGGPSNSKTIAAGADAGLVDIDTSLGYEDAAAAGTGMVLTSTGEILTNNHVIDGATSIRVTDIGNGRTYGATVVGYDRTQDVAILQLKNASGLRTVTLGNSSDVTTSQAVVGVGNAGGVGGTPTYAGGVVEGVGKSITASDDSGGDAEHLTGLFKTNAGIEPGDSGGPLLDTAGQVIGMDTAASAGTEFQAATTTTSFAIPINEAIALARQIEAGRGSTVVHIGSTALLGVEVSATSGAGTALGGTSGTGGTAVGAAIAEVVPGSPAAKAGLAEGDTITAVNGHTVASASDLTNDLVNDQPGQSVEITYVATSGTSGTVSVRLAAGPPQ